MEEHAKVGIEVPGSSYYSDERGFSCCIIGIRTAAGPFMEGWGAARARGSGTGLRAGPRPNVGAGGCCCTVPMECVIVACSVRSELMSQPRRPKL